MTTESMSKEFGEDLDQLVRGETPITESMNGDDEYRALIETAQVLTNRFRPLRPARPGYQAQLEARLIAQLSRATPPWWRRIATGIEHPVPAPRYEGASSDRGAPVRERRRGLAWDSRLGIGRAVSRLTVTVSLAICLLLIVSVGATVFAANKLVRQSVPAPTAAVPAPTAPDRTGNLLPSGLVNPGQKPPSGWLYVLDTNHMAQQSQILLVNPASGRVMGVFRVGAGPDMALAPDGTRLYVASNQQGRSVLSVIETSSGAVLQTVDAPDRRQSVGQPTGPNMAISPDGRWLYMEKMRTLAYGQPDEYTVATFDTVNARFLPEAAPVSDCGVSRLLPTPREREVIVLCTNTNDARFLQLAANGAAASTATLGVPSGRSTPGLGLIAGGALAPDGGTLFIVQQDGGIVMVNIGTRQVTRTVQLARMADRWVVTGQVVLSADGSTLLVGLGAVAARSQRTADEIRVVDAPTGQERKTIKTSQPSLSLAVSRDGRQLHTIRTEGQGIREIDVATTQESGATPNGGETPALEIVAP